MYSGRKGDAFTLATTALGTEVSEGYLAENRLVHSSRKIEVRGKKAKVRQVQE